MANIPDGTPFDEIILPSTHDSAADEIFDLTTTTAEHFATSMKVVFNKNVPSAFHIVANTPSGILSEMKSKIFLYTGHWVSDVQILAAWTNGYTA